MIFQQHKKLLCLLGSFAFGANSVFSTARAFSESERENTTNFLGTTEFPSAFNVENRKKYKSVKIPNSHVDALSSKEQEALKILAQASILLNEVFLLQANEKNFEWRQKIQEIEDDALRKNAELYFKMKNGIIESKKANYYPEDMTVDEFNSWVATLSPENAAKAKGYYWKIVRDENGGLCTMPYSEAYRMYLPAVSKALVEASELVENPNLAKFLQTRSDSLLSDDYIQSEVDWLKVDSKTIDVTIGPYEIYMDELFGMKAAFECFLGVRDTSSTDQLDLFTQNMQFLEDSMPCPSEFKRENIVQGEPIVCINQVFTGGEAKHTPCTIAFNLPNDERVGDTHGHKLVMLRNVTEQKFEHILHPISQIALDFNQNKQITFDAYYTHTLCHEVCHSLGPHSLDPQANNGNKTVREALGSFHSGIEESKADSLGLWSLLKLHKSGMFDCDPKVFHTTFLAGIFRSVRFGLNESHGIGLAMILNYLTAHGGYNFNQDTETFSVNYDKVDEALDKYLFELLSIQGNANLEEAQRFCGKWGVMTPALKAVLDNIEKASIPVDIHIEYDLLSEEEKDVSLILKRFS